MSLAVRWTRRALARLDEIGAYIAQDDPAAAGQVIAKITGAIKLLEERPFIGRPGRLNGTRELIVSGTRYIVAYRVHHNDLDILTILHAAQKWPDRL